jgi:beta-glucosidase
MKFRLGLFTNPYTDPSRQSIILDKKHLALAKSLAMQSAVLLQNNNKRLPMSKNLSSLAVIGPLADDGLNQIGCWAPDGQASDSITPLTSLKASLPNTKIFYSKGVSSCTSTDTSLFN